jgi:hypothetical protein
MGLKNLLSNFVRRMPVPGLVVLTILLSQCIPPYAPCIENKSPSVGVTKSLDVMIEEIKLQISISFFVVGFFGAIAMGKLSMSQTKLNRILVLAATSLGICSIYFGYQLYATLMDLISNDMWCLTCSRTIILSDLQFYCLLVSCISFAILIYELYLHPVKNEKQDA